MDEKSFPSAKGQFQPNLSKSIVWWFVFEDSSFQKGRNSKIEENVTIFSPKPLFHFQQASYLVEMHYKCANKVSYFSLKRNNSTESMSTTCTLGTKQI